MKGRRTEMTRNELHAIYQKSFGAISIHSEYGMTELFSQAYSKGEGKFFCPPWMKIVITAIDDPKQILSKNKTGRINIIDLANIHSIAFIATDDLGKINEDGSFEILGRLDNSDLRGCNLLIA
jgi:acyl-coenzyme A synthetase/AMP-(fatty) acid ligase